MEKRKTFGGSIGFVLAAAGSAVGLGNIWRFPYLAARDGGGLFLVIYIVLALTFGFTLVTAEIAIGRKTKQSPLTAYGVLNKKWTWLGWLSSIVPFIILPYYCVIGGWVLKYLIAFITGHGVDAATEGYFSDFITSKAEPIVMMFIFLLLVCIVIYLGVNKGIESFSKIIMPILLVLVVGIAIFSLTISKTDDSGVVRTGVQGLKYYVIPNLDGITIKKFFTVVMDAMGQLFYSLSVAMGILIAYGSYVRDDANLPKSINQIEIFDTVVAFLAGVMIIPAVYVFSGTEGMSSGPSLMFVALPKIFASMGKIGNLIGVVFFAMVLFAAITSAMSVLEAIVSGMIDSDKNYNRGQAVIIEFFIAFILACLVCFGYNDLYFEFKLPNGAVGQILDIMDYISNSILMPIAAIATCILVGWVIKPKAIIEEVEKNGDKMGRKGLFTIMIKYIAPVCLFILLLMSLGVF